MTNDRRAEKRIGVVAVFLLCNLASIWAQEKLTKSVENEWDGLEAQITFLFASNHTVDEVDWNGNIL